MKVYAIIYILLPFTLISQNKGITHVWHQYNIKRETEKNAHSPDTLGSLGIGLHHLVPSLVLFAQIHAGALADGHAGTRGVQRKTLRAVATLHALPLAARVGREVIARVGATVATDLVRLTTLAMDSWSRERILKVITS